MSLIVRAETRYGALISAAEVSAAYAPALEKARRDGVEPPAPPTKVDRRRAVAATAYVNHGRWVADCPFCPSAQVISIDEPLFFCANCLNGFVSGAYVSLAVPDEAAAIEAALDRRIREEHRNWVPGETAASLDAETDAHQDELGEPDLVEVARLRGRGRRPTGTEPGI